MKVVKLSGRLAVEVSDDLVMFDGYIKENERVYKIPEQIPLDQIPFHLFNNTEEMELACKCYIQLTKISPELGEALFKDANKPGGKNEFMKILLKTIIEARQIK